MKNVLCPNCRKEIPDGARLCPFCETSQTEIPDDHPSDGEASGSPRKTGEIALTCVGVGAGVGAFVGFVVAVVLVIGSHGLQAIHNRGTREAIIVTTFFFTAPPGLIIGAFIGWVISVVLRIREGGKRND